MASIQHTVYDTQIQNKNKKRKKEKKGKWRVYRLLTSSNIYIYITMSVTRAIFGIYPEIDIWV